MDTFWRTTVNSSTKLGSFTHRNLTYTVKIFPQKGLILQSCVFPKLLPQPANIFTRIYPPYPWHFSTLLQGNQLCQHNQFLFHTLVVLSKQNDKVPRMCCKRQTKEVLYKEISQTSPSIGPSGNFPLLLWVAWHRQVPGQTGHGGEGKKRYRRHRGSNHQHLCPEPRNQEWVEREHFHDLRPHWRKL